MSKMGELYEKVAADSTLQEKFFKIAKDAEAAGAEATKEKLTAFAKEVGYDVTMEEMQEFFKELAQSETGELSNVELDQVAGGKGVGTSIAVLGGISSALSFNWALCAQEIGIGVNMDKYYNF